MRAVQSTLFVSILTLLLGVSVQAQAVPSLQPNMLSSHDLELLFEQDGEPMQLALLSEKEMGETQGGYGWVTVKRAITYFRSVRFKVHYDRKPHYFTREQWGRLEGNRPHLQITIYRKGVKGSGEDYRLPAGKAIPWGSHPPHR